MTTLRCRFQPGLVLIAMLCADAAHAGAVTVNVTNQAGRNLEDALIVFDPLDVAPPPSHDTAIIDQIDKRFVPRVNIVRTGTAVTFPNSDHIRHQVYSFSKPKPFTLKLYAGSPPTAILFDKPGLVLLGCNIHDNMVAYVGVVDSPYFSKTAASGAAALTLPAGRYRLRIWHPNLVAAVAPKEIDVQAAPLTIPVAIDVSSTSGVSAWPE